MVKVHTSRRVFGGENMWRSTISQVGSIRAAVLEALDRAKSAFALHARLEVLLASRVHRQQKAVRLTRIVCVEAPERSKISTISINMSL